MPNRCRRPHQERTDTELAKGTVAHWCARFDGAGVPAGPVNSEHSHAVLRDFGFAEQEIVALIESGVVRHD